MNYARRVQYAEEILVWWRDLPALNPLGVQSLTQPFIRSSLSVETWTRPHQTCQPTNYISCLGQSQQEGMGGNNFYSALSSQKLTI